MQMTDFEFQIDNFMMYCTSKNLSPKTMKSYEQTLKLFAKYLQDNFSIEDVERVTTGHIRQYVGYLQDRENIQY
ncbi:site-specific integrase [Anaeromicrobium sediminis]|uniref:site-specific integrase n=1 Tax=Anaeromicrobium sediminis TaxID=1478221 RepID=UPI001A9A2FBA|nr:site-specific integrase [Anaeromicrobium sediminis]